MHLSEIISTMQDKLVDFVATLPTILLGIVIFLVFLWFSQRVSRWIRTFLNQRNRSKNASTVIALIARWGLIVLGVLVALSVALPSSKASDLIQVLGISSVAIGFAFRDIFQNFLAGLIILLTDAFEIGDQIIVESEGLEGTVTDIQTRATTIATYDEREIIIPNATLFTNAVTINTSTQKLRSEQVVGISYDSDIDTARDIIRDEVGEIEGVLSDAPIDVLVDDLAGSSVNLKVRWWTDARRSNVIRTRSEVVRRIKYALDEHDIDIPFPIRTLYVKENVSAGAAAS
jgi:small-conductance mechanosensitive channel